MMQRTKVMVVFESDDLSPMEVLDWVLDTITPYTQKGRAYTPSKTLRTHNDKVEVADYKALDWKGRESTPTKGESYDK